MGASPLQYAIWHCYYQWTPFKFKLFRKVRSNQTVIKRNFVSWSSCTEFVVSHRRHIIADMLSHSLGFSRFNVTPVLITIQTAHWNFFFQFFDLVVILKLYNFYCYLRLKNERSILQSNLNCLMVLKLTRKSLSSGSSTRIRRHLNTGSIRHVDRLSMPGISLNYNILNYFQWLIFK